MSPTTIFDIHRLLGYVPWLLCFGAYFWPKLKEMNRIDAHRADVLWWRALPSTERDVSNSRK